MFHNQNVCSACAVAVVPAEVWILCNICEKIYHLYCSTVPKFDTHVSTWSCTECLNRPLIFNQVLKILEDRGPLGTELNSQFTLMRCGTNPF